MLPSIFPGLLILAVLLMGSAPESKADPTLLRFATSMAENSPVSKVFKVWTQAMNEKSAGMLRLNVSYGQDELAAVDGLSRPERTLDGAQLGGAGLRKISPDLGVLELLGLIAPEAKLGAMRDALIPEVRKRLEPQGFEFVHWAGDKLRPLASKGVPLAEPGSLKGRNFWVPRHDLLASLVARELEAAIVESEPSELSDKLASGGVDVLLAASSAIQERKWMDHLDTALAPSGSIEVSALVFSAKALEALPADLRTIVVDTGKVAGTALINRLRGEEGAAFNRIAARLKPTAPLPEERAKWEAFWARVKKRALEEKAVSAELIAKLEESVK